MVNLDDYKRKIDTILYNRLEGCGKSDVVIEWVHIWLECEWYGCMEEMCIHEKNLLDKYIDESAKEILSNFK